MSVKLPLTKQEMGALLLCIDVAFGKWEANPDEFEEIAEQDYSSEPTDLLWLGKNYTHLMKTIRALGGMQ